ncbi:uncharacterized protein LOC122264204 isoform X2 [Penaeus japonicus]|uniref:uncharacterized protein LOC122264204 isoform X2 n=1 Tax=Penaeus japonicus TaxID=27405 RepID=UPI001C714D2B|nr:uncharacterized protein LOC122264204 isoform X2 [Penaeus japonicus]
MNMIGRKNKFSVAVLLASTAAVTVAISNKPPYLTTPDAGERKGTGNAGTYPVQSLQNGGPYARRRLGYGHGYGEREIKGYGIGHGNGYGIGGHISGGGSEQRALGVTSDSCRYYCRTPGQKVYCCESDAEPITRPTVKFGICPPLELACSSSVVPIACSNDSKCPASEKCCFDPCRQRHVCQLPSPL